MQANELRIGNWVNDMVGTPLKVVAITEDDRIIYSADGGNYLFEIKYAKGIPLTPEILERCGFEQTSNFHPEGPTHTLKHRNGITFEVCYLYKMVDVVENIGRIRIQNIEHLHQLQNLYFALTGSELEIKNLVEV